MYCITFFDTTTCLPTNPQLFLSSVAAAQSLFFLTCSESLLSLLLLVKGLLLVEVDADVARVGLCSEDSVVWDFCLVHFIRLLSALKLTVCGVYF